jgi:hypothetical protein
MAIDVSERRHDRASAAKFLTDIGLKTAPKTLAKLAVVGGGPEFIYWGRKPIYPEPALLAWAESRMTGRLRSTSDRPESSAAA